MDKQTFTLTFGNRAENHKGMQMIGTKLEHGLSVEDLDAAKKYFIDKGARTITVGLNQYLGDVDTEVQEAKILIIPNGVSYLVDTDELYKEVEATPKDSKAFMYGRVVNKKARHNNCFSDFSQEPEYEQGKGTVIDFKDVPLISKIRAEIPKMIPNNLGVVNLQCEGNYYYDIDETYIGFHGDSEREIVIACRLGADFNMGQAKGSGALNADPTSLNYSGGTGPTVQAAANIDGKGDVTSVFGRAFAGVQLNLPYTRLFVQANKVLNNQVVSATAGLRFVY